MHQRIWAILGIIFITARMWAAPSTVPDFSLPSMTGGKPFELSKARGSMVVLHFLLKTECPVCLRHTQDYLNRAGELTNVVQVFIKPDSVEEIQKWTAQLPAMGKDNYPIYRDPDAALAARLKIPGGYKFHGESVHYPALILINEDGQEVFRYVGKSNADRYAFEKLKAKVLELRRN
ncbi:MAG TPA: redoxin domain-containing protein [Methylomirabilota bacterium]|nr:redoxin domain-containing protein [Methylomirabilota bacterium]